MHLCIMYSYQTLFAHCLNPLSPCNAYWCCILDHSANLVHPLDCKKNKFKLMMQCNVLFSIQVSDRVMPCPSMGPKLFWTFQIILVEYQ